MKSNSLFDSNTDTKNTHGRKLSLSRSKHRDIVAGISKIKPIKIILPDISKSILEVSKTDRPSRKTDNIFIKKSSNQYFSRTQRDLRQNTDSALSTFRTEQSPIQDKNPKKNLNSYSMPKSFNSYFINSKRIKTEKTPINYGTKGINSERLRTTVSKFSSIGYLSPNATLTNATLKSFRKTDRSNK